MAPKSAPKKTAGSSALNNDLSKLQNQLTGTQGHLNLFPSAGDSQAKDSALAAILGSLGKNSQQGTSATQAGAAGVQEGGTSQKQSGNSVLNKLIGTTNPLSKKSQFGSQWPPPNNDGNNNSNNGGNNAGDDNDDDAVLKLPKKRPLRAEDYQLRMGPGWTVSDGVWEHVPQNKRRKRDVPYPKYINYTYRAMSGLSSLQIAADAPISMTALDTSCDHTWKCLPKEIRQQLIIPPPNGPALWSLKDAVRADMYQKMSLQIYSDSTAKRYRFYEDLMKKQWVVWPIWVEDEWGMDYVTICWHALATAGAPKSFSRIAGFAIIDPRRHPNPNLKGKHITLNARSTRIEEQLRRFLVNGGYDVANMVRYDVRCSPMRIGEASSGERCFANVKELCSNICDWYYGGMNDERIVFTNLSRWVQPFQQRVEMTGINAWVLMASFEYNARLAVEALMPGERTEVTANGAKRLVYAYDLAAPFEEPAISAQDFLLTATPGFQAPKAAGANSNAPATPPGQGIVNPILTPPNSNGKGAAGWALGNLFGWPAKKN